MSEDTAVAENNEERSKAKRIAEGIFNLIKDIELLDENNIDEELFNRFSFYINQIDEIESLVYEELGNLLNEGESNFVNLEEEAFRVYERRNRNFLILLAEFIARNKHINKKFFYEFASSPKDDKNTLIHAIYRESKLGNFLYTEKYTETKTNDILWLCQILDVLCKKVEEAKFNESQNSSNEEQYFYFLTNLLAFAKRKEFISEELFYDLIFGKLAYDNELCDFAAFFEKVQEGNISFSTDRKQKKFEEILSSFRESDYATNFNIVFGKVVKIYSFAERKFSTKANEFTNNFFGNLSFGESLNFDVNSLRKEFDKWSVSRIIKNYELPASELVVLFSFSRKCWFWNRNKNLQRLLKNINGERGLSKIAYTLSNLPKEQIENFYEWLYQNRDNLITEDGLASDFWIHAQNAGFFSREQEELLKLVPLERQDEFRNLFRNENFRNVCQTPQAIKNLLTITEVCSLSLIEYINNYLRNGVTIEDIRIALDTFDVNKIYETLGEELKQFPECIQKVYAFAYICNWILFISKLNKTTPPIDKGYKNELLKFCSIACNSQEDINDLLMEELLNPKCRDLINKNKERLFTRDVINFYKNKFPGNNILEQEKICQVACDYLNDENGYKIYTVFKLLPNVIESLPKVQNLIFKLPLKLEFIAEILFFVEENRYLNSLNEIISFLNDEKSKNLKAKVMEIIVSKKQPFITKAFENDSAKLKQFHKLIKTDDIFYFINSKDDVLILFELLKLGFDITKTNVLDFEKIKLVMQNVNEKEQFYNVFAELSQKVYSNYIFEFVSNLEREKLNIGENILKLNELSKAGLNISNVHYVSFNDFKEINLMLENKNENEKNKLCQIFAEFSKKKFFIKKAINFSKTIAKGIEENNLSEKNYARLDELLIDSKLIINSNPKLLADFLLLNFKPDKLADIFILLEELISKNKCFGFADDFKCHLGAHPKVAEALATGENIPKLEAVINRTEARAQ